MGDFKQLRAWQEAKKLAVLSKAAIAKLPADERYALGDQWRRAAYSVALNLGEGASRRGPREFRRFLDIARSSLHELEAIFELVAAQGYLTEPESVVQRPHSHSIVAGGFELTSYTTRFTPRTSLMIRLLMRASTSGGKANQSAVIPSRLVTARSATT